MKRATYKVVIEFLVDKKVNYNKKNWDSKIKHALWDDQITNKEATRKSPFELVHGMDVTCPFT
jgi:hypothetical protein